MPLRCVHSCPKNFETSRKASLTHHQAQCPAYVVQRTAAERLRATRSNKKQRIARNKLVRYRSVAMVTLIIILFISSQRDPLILTALFTLLGASTCYVGSVLML